MNLQVSSRLVDHHAIVAAQGEIDLSSCEKLRDVLAADECHTADAVVIDLTSVHFIDSTGLSVLVDGARQARSHDQSFGVVADGHLRELLRITGLDTVMQVHPRLADALPGDGDRTEEAPLP